jgi:hypothetical protein
LSSRINVLLFFPALTKQANGLISWINRKIRQFRSSGQTASGEGKARSIGLSETMLRSTAAD